MAVKSWQGSGAGRQKAKVLSHECFEQTERKRTKEKQKMQNAGGSIEGQTGLRTRDTTCPALRLRVKKQKNVQINRQGGESLTSGAL